MRYGLIAGGGQFPFLIADGARRAGASLAVAAIKDEADPRIESVAGAFEWIPFGQLSKLLTFFKDQGVDQAFMAGTVKHTQIFSNVIPDVRALKLLWSLPERNTDALLGGLVGELGKEGIELMDSTYFVRDLLASAGVLSHRSPNEQELMNIEYGLGIAREIARLDLGQTIVVRGRACVAIEAMEGTDAAIRRAGELARGKLTVIKVAKPGQDMRFDVPVVGVPTITVMIEAGATCLSITEGKTLMFDRDEMLALAKANKIAIVGSPAETNHPIAA